MRISLKIRKGTTAVINKIIETDEVWFEKGMHICFRGKDIYCRYMSAEMYRLVADGLIKTGFCNLSNYTFYEDE